VVVRISVEVQGKWHDVLMDFRLRERRVVELEELEMEEVDFQSPPLHVARGDCDPLEVDEPYVGHEQTWLW
jgi:hypothetical protein